MQPANFSVLLVDDDPMVVRILSRILAEFAPLRFATSGHAALALARESVPDMVILDVEMPEFNGFEVCKAFKADPLLAGVPIIFISSHDSPLLQAKGLELGAVDFIAKPPHAPLVLARVRTHQRMKVLSDTVRSAVSMDFVTGTLSRRAFDKSLAQEWQRAERTFAALSLLLVDIDGFTAYNRDFGEQQGDVCLHAVADALRSITNRPMDLIGRYAGGKFAVLLPETGSKGAETVARRALEAVQALQLSESIPAAGRHVTITVGGACRALRRLRDEVISEGHSRLPTDCSTSVELAAHAESALDRAKAAGAGTVHMTAIGLGSPASSLG